MSILDQSLQYAELHFNQFLDDLFDCLSIPSISTLSDHQSDIKDCASFLINHMESIGLNNIQSFNTFLPQKHSS